VRLGSGSFPRFSPDGHSLIALTPLSTGPQQLVLLSVEAGTTRQLTSSDAAYATPSFADPKTLLFVRSKGGVSEVWRMDTDGKNERSLGAAACDLPVANPSGTSFVCRGGNELGVLYVYPMKPGPGRRLLGLGAGETVLGFRWNAAGTEVYAVTADRQLLGVDSSSGLVKWRRPLELGDEYGSDTLLAVVLDADASTLALSLDRFSSGLYVATGFE
jgi:hypothetical protein